MRPVVFLLPLLLALARPAAAWDCPPDTLDLYGGPGSFDGKFQTPAGEPDAQGWIHRDDSVDSAPRWRVSTYAAAVLDTATPGNHAWWCGDHFPACPADDAPGGYGNGWDARLAWTGAIDPVRPAVVRVTGRIRHDLEPGYDVVRVEFVKAGQVVQAAAWDGTAIRDLDATAAYAPGEFWGPGGDSVRVQLRVVTDGAWSDEDCLWPSSGAVQADLLQVTVQQGDDPPWSGPVETCEPGDPRSWRELPPTGVGDFAQLRADLPELDPDRDNPSPQWAFVDDGVVVPGVGPTFVAHPAYPESTYAVTINGGALGGGHTLVNTLLSPPIALPEGWCGALLLGWDAYFDSSPCPPTWEACGLAVTADPAGLAGWQEVWDPFLRSGDAGRFHRPAVAFDLDVVPADTRWVRVLLQARQLPVWCWTWDPRPGPTYDNVRLQLVPSGLSPVPPAAGSFTATAAPNPFNPAVAVAWNLPRAGDLEVRVYDLAGRLVRELHRGPAAAGAGSAVWRGRDGAGRAVAAGVYFCRLRAGGEQRVLKLTLLR